MMSSNSANNLLDEALGFNDDGGGGGLLLLIEDCVETSGAFILHHLIKRRLSSPNRPNDVVVFLSFAHPFSHYDRILRKMGCNLGVQKENKRFVYHDMLNLNYPGAIEYFVEVISIGECQRFYLCAMVNNLIIADIFVKIQDGEKGAEDLLLSVYGKIQKTVELCSSREGYKNSTIMIDDISLMEVALCGSSNLVLDFLRYCYSLATQFDCLVIILNHEDVYSTMDMPSPLLQMEYLANIVIKAEPLATGLATDVHGQLTVLNKGICQGSGYSKSKIHNFHFRVKENCVEYFYPGSRT